jgi:hypothetical protein
MSAPLMTAHHFTAADCAGILAGFGLFSLIALAPGYALGWLLDLLQFRRRTVACQFALSVTLSIALGPLTTYFVARAWSLLAALLLYAVFAIFALSRLGKPLKLPAGSGKIVAAAAAWIALAVLSLMDLQIGRRLYFSVTAFDYAVRTAFTNSIATYGVPARNPFFFPGHGVPLRYHYFWLMQAALTEKLGLDARFAFMGATLWSGIGLMCTIALYLRFFSPTGTLALTKRTFIGIGLLGVTGLDLLPALGLLWLVKTMHSGLLPPSAEWWNDQVDGFLYTMLWEPHYLAGLIACLTGFLLLWELPASRMRASVAAGIAGLAFASAAGAAFYVAMVFSVFLMVWTAVLLVKGWRRDALFTVLAGAMAAAAALPFLLSLRGAGAGGALLRLAVRRFYPGEFLLKMLGLTQPWQRTFGDLLLLPLNYFLELGFFCAAGVLIWRNFRLRRGPAARHELAACSLLASSVLVCTFVRSGIIGNNDLGWRGFLLAQFVLLIGAADLLAAKVASHKMRFWLGLLLVLGVSGTVYDLTLLRIFPLLADNGWVPKVAWMSRDAQLGSRTYANREAYEWLKSNTPASVVIQQNPNPETEDLFYGLYANRQTVAEDRACGTIFGGDGGECQPIYARLSKLYSKATGESEEAFPDACATLPMDFVVAKDTDGAWSNKKSWVWNRTPSFSNNFVRLFPCGKKTGGNER